VSKGSRNRQQAREKITKMRAWRRGGDGVAVVRWVTGRARCGRVTGSSGRVVVYGGEARELDA
jgi:hypothetical protein